jgi:protein phosphatase
MTDTVPKAPDSPQSINLPVLAFEDDEVEQTSFGLDPTKIGALDATTRDPEILFDDDALPEEPTAAHRLMLVSATGQSDPGKRREQNEDSLLVEEAEGLFVVADGMGGYRGGDVASTLAVATIHDAFTSQQFDGSPHAMLPRRASELARAIQMANRAIFARASEEKTLQGMGTTVSAARFSVNKQRLYIGHVGDSRVYRLRDGVLRQMTADHTMKDLGVVGSASVHLSRAVGIWPVVPVDVIVGKPRVGDVYLLCSDGLPKMVSDAQIAEVLGDHEPSEAVEALIRLANEAGGKDNVTVVVVCIHEPFEKGGRDGDRHAAA